MPVGGDEERDAPAEAEADDRDVAVGEPDAVQVAERGVDVGEDRLVAPDPDEVVDHRREVGVVDHCARARAVEHVGRHRVVAGGRKPAGDVLDVGVDAERLLDHDDRTERFGVGEGLVAPHRALGGLHLLLAGSHVSEPNDSSRPLTRHTRVTPGRPSAANRFEHVVDHAVVERLRGGEPAVAVAVGEHPLDGLAGVLAVSSAMR